MSIATEAAGRLRFAALRDELLYRLRVLHVVASAEFKLKYAGSALGYIWSLIKPLTLFTMLYLVFGRVFKLGEISRYYPLSLLIGIVVFTFFSDATNLGMTSLVARVTLLRKLAFPRMVVPTAATLTAAMTFGVNLIAIVAFLVWNEIVPRPSWLLLIPLLLELYVFTLAVALILATLFVRVRDIGQVWELALQVIFYASPIIYPIGYLPEWARKVVFLNPLTQILQDIRAVVLSVDLPPNRITVTEAFHVSAARLIPLTVVAVFVIIAVVLFRREEPYFAERV
jgi:ABC-2 type transport system permease protein